MKNCDARRRKYIFMYPDVKQPTLLDIDQSYAPRERLVGLYELKERGWDVEISDSRWKGWLAGTRRKCKRYFTLPSIATFRDWLPADVVVIKDDFALSLSFGVKILGKKLVYLDSMFSLPNNKIRLILLRLNILLSDRVICFSSTQADLWAKELNVSRSKFSVTRYGLDIDFYRALMPSIVQNGISIVAVGRDVGRDFATLIDVASRKSIDLYLVTLPYLLPKSIDGMPNVFIKERLSYDRLFELYAQSSIAVVTLSDRLTYPSGIRAVMEGMLLGLPVIATRTPVLEEYFVHGEHILFVEPGSVSDLSEKIDILLKDEALYSMLAKGGRMRMEKDFSLNNYVTALESILEAT